MLVQEKKLDELSGFVHKLVTDKDVLIDVATNGFELLLQVRTLG
jgi:hypothetical protein